MTPTGQINMPEEAKPDAVPDLTQAGKLPWFRRERREALTYREQLSNKLVYIAGAVAIFVLLDPRLAVPIGTAGTILTLGGDGFSAEIKGVVIGVFLTEGIKKVGEFFLGSTAAGQETSKVVERMAEKAPEALKDAVAAARAPPLPEAPSGQTAVTPAPPTESQAAAGIVPAAAVAPTATPTGAKP